MISPLIFMMGEFEAEIPTDRQYAENHMWAQLQEVGTDRYRVGFSAYAVRLLQDVYFLDWLLEAPASLQVGQEIGAIESKKAESSLYAPASGQLLSFNESLMDDPSAINTDKHGEGWLMELQLPSPKLLTAEQYVDRLGDVWEKTQRTIKGQLN